MNPDVALRSITACLERLAPGGTLKVAFFGGEPLMNWPLLQEIVRRCESDIKLRYQDRHIAYHLTSNLTMCPPGLTDLLLRHRFTVMCDIDGPPEIHNRCRPYLKGRPSHARTAATIARLVDAGVPVALRATVTSINEDRIFDIAAHHKELGANTSAFVPVSPVNSDRQFLPRGLLPDPDKLAGRLAEVYRSGLWDKRALFPFNEYLLKLRPGAHQITACAAPSGTTPVVRTNGDVYFCIYLVGQEKYRFGSLGAEWDSRSMDAATAALHVDNVEGCRACPWRYACGGGCPVLNQVQFDAAEKNAEALEYGRKLNCDFTKAILTELLWDIADEAKTGTPSDTREGCHLCPSRPVSAESPWTRFPSPFAHLRRPGLARWRGADAISRTGDQSGLARGIGWSAQQPHVLELPAIKFNVGFAWVAHRNCHPVAGLRTKSASCRALHFIQQR
jgi:uncharacterized protein